MYHTCSFASVLATLHLQISRSHDPQGSSRILGDENKEGNEKKERKVKKLPRVPCFLRHQGFRGTCSWRHAMHTSCGVTSTATGEGERREPRIISSICGVSWSNRGRNHGPKGGEEEEGGIGEIPARRMKWNYAREGCTRGKTARVPLLARCHLHLEFFGHLSASELRFLRVTSRGGPENRSKGTIIAKGIIFNRYLLYFFPLISFFFFFVWMERLWFDESFLMTRKQKVWNYSILTSSSKFKFWIIVHIQSVNYKIKIQEIILLNYSERNIFCC